MNATRQISRRYGRATGARTRSASFDCIGRTVSFGPDPLEPYIIHSFVIKVFELSMNVLGVGQCLRVSTLGFAFRVALLCSCSIALARFLCQGRFCHIAFGGRGHFPAGNLKEP